MSWVYRKFMGPSRLFAAVLLVLAVWSLFDDDMRAWWHTPLLLLILAVEEIKRWVTRWADRLTAELEAMQS